MTELWRLGAVQLTQGYANGDFTPGEVLEAVLNRVAECQPHTNAMVHVDRMAKLVSSASRLRWARHKPLGPLDGVPISLKDNLHAGGLPTTWGSKLLKGFVARRDELPVAKLRAAGAMLFGKTNLPEFAMQGYTGNPLHGVTRNPWNLALTPGGSSGGAVAAVASGCGPLALGTDGGGSIRRPASHCGLVGFKPTANAVAREGGLPECFLHYESVGAIGRNVADVVHLMQCIATPSPVPSEQPPPARILYVPRFGSHPVDPGIAARVAESARQWQALGHTVEEAGSFDLAEAVNDQWMVLSSVGLAWVMEQKHLIAELSLRPGELPAIAECGAELQARIAEGRSAGATALFGLLSAVAALKQKLDALFLQHDFILTPATAALPWPAELTHPSEIDGQSVGGRGHAVFTGFANAAGLPGIALPCGDVDGLPTGFQLVGRPGADAEVLAMAAQYEQAHPWASRWPELPA